MAQFVPKQQSYFSILLKKSLNHKKRKLKIDENLKNA